MAEDKPMDSIREANYIKLDGRVFSITPIANSEMNIEAELKQFYNEKYNAHVTNFNGGYVAGMTEDWEAQINKLQEHNRRSTVTVPAAMMGKIMTCDGNELHEVRGMVYSPNVFKMVRADIANHLRIQHHDDVEDEGTEDERRHREYEGTISIPGDAEDIDLNDFSDDEVLLVEVRRKIFHCAMYSFSSRSNRMFCTNLTTFHNQGTSICTGSNRASDFWNSPDFETLMNQVNCFSLGSQSVQYRTGEGTAHGIAAYVKRATILSVQPERSGQWRT